MLEYETDPALMHGLARHVLGAEQNLPVVRKFKPGDDPQQRRLTGPGRTQERDQLA
jgi:hypothetical protein